MLLMQCLLISKRRCTEVVCVTQPYFIVHLSLFSLRLLLSVSETFLCRPQSPKDSSLGQLWSLADA